jgi:pimeloyl-ACP methyl ester carboxylesterase
MTTERVVPLRGGTVKFRVLSGGRGPALVYLHSFHDKEPWPALLGRLAERFAVHAPLHPGVQGSDGVEELDDVVDLALAYDELLGALGLDSALVLGHFFGAMMAAELASLCPSRVSKLCLVSPLGFWLDGKPVADVLTLPASDLQRLLWSDPESEVARRWAAVPESEDARAALLVEQIQRLAVMGKFVWPIPDKGLKKRVHRITAPTLILWGDDDRVNPRPYGELFAGRIPGARLQQVRGGHMLHLESVDTVLSAVTSFFGSTVGAPPRPPVGHNTLSV